MNSITIGENVKHIPSCAFEGCRGLTSIVIPSGVTLIGSMAFSLCDNLKLISYMGTMDQWKYVIGGKSQIVPLDCVVKCIDGTIQPNLWNKWPVF